MTIKTSSDHVLRVYRSILLKKSTLALAPEIAYLGVSKYQELNNQYENPSGLTIQGLHVDCAKTVNMKMSNSGFKTNSKICRS